MAANNQGIAHYAPKGAPVCRNQRAHIVARTADDFAREPKQCKRCAAYVARVAKMKADRQPEPPQTAAELEPRGMDPNDDGGTPTAGEMAEAEFVERDFRDHREEY